MWVVQSVLLPSLPLSLLCVCVCVCVCERERVCLRVHMCECTWNFSFLFFFFPFLQVVIHYSVSSFPWCLTATGTLCLEKMTSSSGRQYYLIPLFPSDCLALLWSPIRAFTVDCIVSISVCLSTFGSLVLLVFSLHDSFFFLLLFLSFTFCRSPCLL